MNTSTIDTAVENFVVTISKDGQQGIKFYLSGEKNDVRERVYRATTDGKFFAEIKPVKQLSAGVYCITQ